jgi:hypothetical protein
MALTITQNPADVSLAQSPMVFTLSETDNVVTSSFFQYYMNLQYWTGSLSASGSSSQYTLVKYPNASRVGIFDVSKVINATLQDLRQTNPSNVKYYKVDGFSRFLSGSVYITGSHATSSVYKALDGYSLFQEQINGDIQSKSPHWPMMTDGPITQSVFSDNTGTIGVYTGPVGVSAQPTKVIYTLLDSTLTGSLNVSSSVSSSQQIQQVPAYPLSAGFPFPTASVGYTIQAYATGEPLGLPIYYELVCEQKYPNVRIKWKNRYGQFDYFNFYMVSKKSFQTEKRTYQPQIGTWNGATLTYSNYDSQNLNYLVDSKQAITVNSFWVDEDYNDIFKQLMVSDEIYYVTTESTDNLTPITIDTETIDFKTKAVDKLIQYSFDFRYGQGYKLII